MIDLPALIDVAIGFAFSATGLLASRVPPVHDGRRESCAPADSAGTRAWEAAQVEAGPWLLAAGIANLLAGAALFGMPAGGASIPVLVMAAVLTVVLLAVAVLMSAWTAAARQDDP